MARLRREVHFDHPVHIYYYNSLFLFFELQTQIDFRILIRNFDKKKLTALGLES